MDPSDSRVWDQLLFAAPGGVGDYDFHQKYFLELVMHLRHLCGCSDAAAMIATVGGCQQPPKSTEGTTMVGRLERQLYFAMREQVGHQAFQCSHGDEEKHRWRRRERSERS